MRKQKTSGHGLETQVQFVPKHCIPIRYQFYELLQKWNKAIILTYFSNTSNRKVQQMGKDSAIGPELSENILGSLVDMRGLFEHSKGFN